MENYRHYQDPPQSSSDEEEITFLLRLKPAPTPPIRRRKNVATPPSSIAATPKGWDVVIERRDRDVSNSNPPSISSSPVRQRRFSFDSKSENRGSYQDRTKEDDPPPIPPRFKPSAPPHESIENFCWWGSNSG